MPTYPELDRWKPVAAKLKRVASRDVPLPRLMRAARTVAAFVRNNWEPTPDRPGLRDAGPRMSLTIADELDSLADALTQARAQYQALFQPTGEPELLMNRGEVLLRELTLAIEWQLEELDNEKLESLGALTAQTQRDPASAEELADALRDYAAVAHLYADRLRELPGYAPSLPDQASEVARQLDLLTEKASDHTGERAQAQGLMERVAQLIQNRLKLVRQAAAYTFRERDDLLRAVADHPHRLERAAQHRAALLYERRRMRKPTVSRRNPHPQPVL